MGSFRLLQSSNSSLCVTFLLSNLDAITGGMQSVWLLLCCVKSKFRIIIRMSLEALKRYFVPALQSIRVLGVMAYSLLPIMMLPLPARI